MTSARGVAVYPALNRPDTKFDELGQYKADVKLSAEDAAPLIAKIQAVAKEHMGKVMPKAKNSAFEAVLNDEVKKRAKSCSKSASRTSSASPMVSCGTADRWSSMPKRMTSRWPSPSGRHHDAGAVRGLPVEHGGQEGHLASAVMVQVIDLVTGGGRGDADAFDEEDGYEAEEETQANKSGFDNEDDSSTPDTDNGDY